MNMIHRGDSLKITIRKRRQSAAEMAAREIAGIIERNPAAVFGVTACKSLMPVYKELIRLYREEGLDFCRTKFFHLDGDSQMNSNNSSLRGAMWRKFYTLVNIQPANVRITSCSASARGDLQAGITDAGGLDAALLSVDDASRLSGEDVHELRDLDAPRPIDGQNMIAGAGTVLNARCCLLFAAGDDAAASVAQAVEGAHVVSMAALLLKQHDDASIFMDERAAGLLALKDYYQWVASGHPFRPQMDLTFLKKDVPVRHFEELDVACY